MWNHAGNAALVNDGGRTMFKGIIRGQGNSPVVFLAPSRDVMDQWLEDLPLKDWIYYIKELTDSELGTVFMEITKGGWCKEQQLGLEEKAG